jgi:hypothetical protein
MHNQEQVELASEFESAARRAFTSLFESHHEDFYYCALIVQRNSRTYPIISAWSRESLQSACAGSDAEVNCYVDKRWSYADSPYCGYRRELFDKTRRLLLNVGNKDEDEGSRHAQWTAHYQMAQNVMCRLDASGLFGGTLNRERMVISVEQAGCGMTVDVARHLNPEKAISEWLEWHEPTRLYLEVQWPLDHVDCEHVTVAIAELKLESNATCANTVVHTPDNATWVGIDIRSDYNKTRSLLESHQEKGKLRIAILASGIFADSSDGAWRISDCDVIEFGI